MNHRKKQFVRWMCVALAVLMIASVAMPVISQLVL